MGMQTINFKCPHCEWMISEGAAGGPNWTVIGPFYRQPLIMLSCPKCNKGIGAVLQERPASR